MLSAPATALVVFAVGRTRTWAVVIRAPESTIVELDITPEDLSSRAELWRRLGEQNADRLQWEAIASRLAGSVLVPVVETGLLDGVEAVHVVPDDAMHLVSFAELLRYAVDGATPLPVVSQTPSLSLLEQSEESAESDGPVVGFGAGGSSATIDEMSVLAAAGARVFVGSRVTEATWLAEAPAASALHFGGHTAVSSGNLAAMGLQLAGSQRADGLLTIPEILGTQLNGPIVVLLSCDTATGPSQKGPGRYYRQTPSVGEAFLRAGASAVVGNLWPVTEKDAQLLAAEFYRAGGTERGASALTEALDVLREKFPDQPRRWAGTIWMGRVRLAH